MKDKIAEYIERTAQTTADKIRRVQPINYYRAMERCLRTFKKVGRQLADPDDYGFMPIGRSHSITTAPPPGSGVVSRDELMETLTAARLRAYGNTAEDYFKISAVVKMFEEKPEFIVIRMYYFNEDANGNDRPEDAKPYTFEEIADELAAIGMERGEKTLRSWRTNLVQDMTVALFGPVGALSVETREKWTHSPENTQQDKTQHGSEHTAETQNPAANDPAIDKGGQKK